MNDRKVLATETQMLRELVKYLKSSDASQKDLEERISTAREITEIRFSSYENDIITQYYNDTYNMFSLQLESEISHSDKGLSPNQIAETVNEITKEYLKVLIIQRKLCSIQALVECHDLSELKELLGLLKQHPILLKTERVTNNYARGKIIPLFQAILNLAHKTNGDIFDRLDTISEG